MVKKGRVRSSGKQAKGQTSPGRRRFLKTAAVTAGVAAMATVVRASVILRAVRTRQILSVGGGSALQ